MNFVKSFLFLSFILGLPISAKMVFETQVLEVTVPPDQYDVIGEFPFKIEGGPAEIIEYKALCSCLEARVEPLMPDRSTKLHWVEGESGVIKTKFDTSKFLGTVEKSIQLTLAGVEEPVILTMKITVPEVLQVEPGTVRWDLNGEMDERTVKITVNHTKPIHIRTHRSNNEAMFPYEFKVIREGWEYELKVKPAQNKVAGMGVISLLTDSDLPRFKRFSCYTVVRPTYKK